MPCRQSDFVVFAMACCQSLPVWPRVRMSADTNSKISPRLNLAEIEAVPARRPQKTDGQVPDCRVVHVRTRSTLVLIKPGNTITAVDISVGSGDRPRCAVLKLLTSAVRPSSWASLPQSFLEGKHDAGPMR